MDPLNTDAQSYLKPIQQSFFTFFVCPMRAQWSVVEKSSKTVIKTEKWLLRHDFSVMRWVSLSTSLLCYNSISSTQAGFSSVTGSRLNGGLTVKPLHSHLCLFSTVSTLCSHSEILLHQFWPFLNCPTMSLMLNQWRTFLSILNAFTDQSLEHSFGSNPHRSGGSRPIMCNYIYGRKTRGIMWWFSFISHADTCRKSSVPWFVKECFHNQEVVFQF